MIFILIIAGRIWSVRFSNGSRYAAMPFAMVTIFAL